MKRNNLNDVIESTLGLIFNELTECSDFDAAVRVAEFDNYAVLVDEVWTVCPYIKFESIVEIWKKWLKSLES